MPSTSPSGFDSELAIKLGDNWQARQLLVKELSQIPEFVELWDRVRATVSPRMQELMTGLHSALREMSPEGRAAFIAFAIAAFESHPEYYALCSDVHKQELLPALGIVQKMLQVAREPVSREVNSLNLGSNYMDCLDSMVKPLCVPGLAGELMLVDAMKWGFDVEWFLPIDGPIAYIYEGTYLRQLAGLSTMDASEEPPGRVRRNTLTTLAPVRRHIKRYDLPQRIHLWVRNKVYGETIEHVANSLGLAGNFEWVKQQIHEATRDLGAKVPVRRPPKGGGLRWWKMTP